MNLFQKNHLADFVFLCVFAFTPAFLAAQQQATPEEKIDQLFAMWDQQGVPGASVAVVQDGEVVFAKGYGSANLEYDIPNSPTTVFHIASVSKQFTAFAIAKLAEEGKLSLDDDIRKHLPELHEFEDTITIRHLIHHTSGLRDQWNLLAIAGWRLDDVITEEQIMKLIVRQKELNFKPGAEYVYCNTGYTLLAKIVEKVSDQSFPEWTEENIFKPLGMEQTLFYDDHEKIVKGRAYSYYPHGIGYKKSILSYANVGATSLFTTVEDLSKWVLNFENPKVGSKSLMEQMHQRGVLNSGDTIGYAFGQGVGNYKGLPMVSHDGADAGYRTLLARFPEQRFSVIVLSNLAVFDPGSIGMKIADIYLEELLKEEAKKEETTPKSEQTEKPEKITIAPAILKEYIGKYKLTSELILSISLENDRLVGQATNQPKVKLEVQSDIAFFVPEANAKITFHRNEAGAVHQLVFVQGEHTITAPKLKNFDPAAVDLTAFTGEFYSEELGTTYTFAVKDDQLVAQHQRHPDIELKPTKENFFLGNTWFFGGTEFVRNETGAITGIKVSSGRVRNLWFEKVK